MASKNTDRRSSKTGTVKKSGTRSQSSQKRTSQKNSTQARKRKAPVQDERVNDSVKDEVALIITFLISLLLVLSYFHLCGPFGDVVNHVIFGLIGYFTYLFPFALFFMVAFTISNRGNVVAKRKVIGSIVLLFALTSLIQMISGYDSTTKYFDYYVNSSKEFNGGGLVGGTLIKLLCPLFGTIATVIILIAIVLLCIIFISGKAIVTLIRRLGEEKLAQHKEQRAMYAEEYEQLDMEDQTYSNERRKARTITFGKTKEKENVNEDEDLFVPEDEEDEPVNFLDELKKKGKSKHQTEPVEPTINGVRSTDIELQEIKPNESDMQFGPSDEMIEDVNTIYEEELKRKFGEGIEKTAEPVITLQSHDMHEFNPEMHEIHADVTAGYPEEVISETGEVLMEEDNAVHEQHHEEMPSTEAAHPEAAKPAAKKENGEPASIEELGDIHQVLEVEKKYEFPPISLLSKPKGNAKGMSDRDLKETANKLQKTLESFGVRVTITNISCGPAVTRYELQPEQGVKVSKITGLADDIKLNLAAADVRIEAPIPGKAAVGIEVPNKENSAVMLRELLDTQEFKSHPSDIAFAVGKDIGGQAVVTDIAKMPHLLIAGATGSGKSVCINTLIMSILYKANPADVRLIMVDPKVVELSVYNGIPHLLIPVVTDPKKASAALNWAVAEMTERYRKFAEVGVRDLKGYNERVAEVAELNDPAYQKLPQIVIIVDELADLMMVAPGEVEDAICRLAQMARAAGLHLIIATQRPSVNVITGLIKANVPSRIAFSVSSAIDSRTIIDSSGAEKLLGKGDMLFFPSGYPKPVRVQGAFVSDKEVSAVVDFLKEQSSHVGYSEEVDNMIKNAQTSGGGSAASTERDDYFIEAAKFIIEKDKASIGMLQRVYKIGFNRAARIMEQLADAGVVGPEEGTKPRKILMTEEEFERFVDEYV